MNPPSSHLHSPGSIDEIAAQALYRQLLDAWNTRNSAAYAGLFTEDANVIGFDGSMMNGQAEIEATLGQIFADHPTAAYVGKVSGVRLIAAGVAIVRALAGMVPPGQKDLSPAVNTVQTLVATRRADVWRIVLFQNTPAQFHGRPELVEQMTEELRQLL